jgi:hypothetical protein
MKGKMFSFGFQFRGGTATTLSLKTMRTSGTAQQ